MSRILKGLTVAVSGGSKFLGWSSINRLSNQGCQMIICDNEEPRHELPANCYFIKTDITDVSSVQNTFEEIENKYKKLDVLVNSDVIGRLKKMFNKSNNIPINEEFFWQVIKPITYGTFYMMSNACRLFDKNQPNENGERGCIINTTSFPAFDGQESQVVDAASFGAVVSMTLPAARDLKDMGVRVNTISIGFFNGFREGSNVQSTLEIGNAVVTFPKRFGQPDEYAHLVQCIIENPMINGEVIKIDAGLRIPL